MVCAFFFFNLNEMHGVKMIRCSAIPLIPLPLYFSLCISLSLALSLYHSTVKYIKEMSAFFKNSSSGTPSLLDSPPSTPQRQVDPVMKETRSIPLKMCYVTRRQCPPDTEDRYCRVHTNPRLSFFLSLNHGVNYR